MGLASIDIPLELEGREPLAMRFSFKCLAALQDHWQLVNLEEVQKKLATLETGQLTTDDLVTVFWALLRTHHPDIGRELCLDILDDIGPLHFELLITQAAVAAVKREGGGKASANPPVKSSKSRGQ